MEIIREITELIASPVGASILVAAITSLGMEKKIKPVIKKIKQTEDRKIPWWVWMLSAVSLSLITTVGITILADYSVIQGVGILATGYSLQAAFSSNINAYFKERDSRKS